MANFAIDPTPFTPPNLFLEDGGPHRRARQVVYISRGVSKMHEDCAIAVVNEDLSPAQRHQLLHEINHHTVHEVQQQVHYFALHPHGVGIFMLRNACQRDTLIAQNPHFVGLKQVTFCPHDEAPMNFRRAAFIRKCWILLLGYPLDFKDSTILTQVCAPFASPPLEF
jgi:hypothetical protein